MKRLFFTLFAAAFMCSGASAQISAFPIETTWGVEGYTLPRTVIVVSVTQQREVIIRGPYARYAAEYLGVTGAPMSDRETYSILGASLSWSAEPDPNQVYGLDPKKSGDVKVFNWLAPSAELSTTAHLEDVDFLDAKFGGRTPFKDMGTSTVVENSLGQSVFNSSAVEKSEQQMAADAASIIFKLRKRRVELITAELGENVFGAGMDAALKEIARLEEEYVSLFLGKRMVQKNEVKFLVIPNAADQRAVAFRFTPEGGVVSASDLTATPVSIEFKSLDSGAQAQDKAVRGGVTYRIPQLCEVTLNDGVKVLTQSNIPIFQKGVLHTAPML